MTDRPRMTISSLLSSPIYSFIPSRVIGQHFLFYVGMSERCVGVCARACQQGIHTWCSGGLCEYHMPINSVVLISIH